MRPKDLSRAIALLALLALLGCDAAVEEEVVFVAPEPITLEPSAAVEPSTASIAPTRSSSRGAPRAGVVTAGDIDDGLNLAAFKRYASRARSDLKLPVTNLNRPVLLSLFGANGLPAPGARITLRKPGVSEPFYDGYAGVGGHVTVFPAALGAGSLTRVEMRAFPEAQGAPFETTVDIKSKREMRALPFSSDWSPEFLDLVFVLDTTGSMGDELAWLTKELQSIVRRAQRKAPGVDIRFGLVTYRDKGDEYVLRSRGMTGRSTEMTRWLRSERAAGGGDYPEAAAEALEAATQLQWRRGKGERLIFHVADAPPHKKDARRYIAAANKAAQQNIQIFGLGASGVGDEAEFLMRQAALVTGGRYLFLTDDSGVGLSHAEPKVACYRVTALKSLVERVLISELTGRRVEAAPNQVIRSVGSYRNGVCLQ